MKSHLQSGGQFGLEGLEPRLLLSADPIGELLVEEREIEIDSTEIVVAETFDSVAQEQDPDESQDTLTDVDDEPLPGATGVDPDSGQQDAATVVEPTNVYTISRGGYSVDPSALSATAFSGHSSIMADRMVKVLHAGNGPPSGDPVHSNTFIGASGVPSLLNEAAVDSVLRQAISNWSLYTTTPEQIERLSSFTLSFADLPAGVLGQAEGNTITIDADASGLGWFVDSTPWEHSEFLQQPDGRHAGGQGVDLLTIVSHEVGHVLGLGHSDGLMGEYFSSGERFLISESTILPNHFQVHQGVQYALADQVEAGLGDLSDALWEVVSTDDNFTDPHIPGVRFDDVNTGEVTPTVLDGLQLDVNQRPGATTYLSNSTAIVFANAFLGTSITGPEDLAGIADALNHPDFVSEFENVSDPFVLIEIAFALLDLDESGAVDLNEAYSVLVAGQLTDFINDFPTTKFVWDGGDEELDEVSTTFADLRDGFTNQVNGGGAGTSYGGFTDYMDDLAEPSYLDSYIDLFVTGVTDVSDGNELSYEVTFTVSFVDEYLIDLGIAVEELEIDLPDRTYDPAAAGDPYFDPEPVTDLVGTLSMPMTFTATSADFSFGVQSDFIYRVDIFKDMENLTVNVGFLGMFGGTGAEMNFNLPTNIEITDPSSPYHLGFGQPDFAAGEDGVLEFTSGTVSATFALDAEDTILVSDVIFSLGFGTQGADPVEVTVTAASTADNYDELIPTDAATARANLVADVNSALASAGLGNVISASLDLDGKIVLTLATTDAAALGFISQEQFAAAGNTLTADNVIGVDFLSTDDEDFEGAILVSISGATPVLITFSFTVSGGDAGTRRTSFVDQANDAIDAALGAGVLELTLSGSDEVELTPDDGLDTLEITRTVDMQATFEITKAEFDAVIPDHPDKLFNVYPDPDADFFEIDLPLEVKSGITVTNGSLGGQDIYITADFRVDDGGTIVYPMEADIEEDYIEQLRFDLGQYLELTGTALSTFELNPAAYSFQKLLDFNVIGPAEVINLIGQLKGWLDRLPTTSMLAGFDIPFSEATLGDLLDFAGVLQDAVLFDDNGNGMEAPDDPEFDDVGRLLYYLEDLDETILSVAFATAQELAKVLDDLPYVTVDGGVAHYDVGEQELTYDVRVEGNGPLVTAPIDFELDLDPIFDLSAIADTYIGTALFVEATIGFDLAPSATFSETDSLSTLNNGDGVIIRTDLGLTGYEDVARIFGRLSDDATFTLTTYDPSATTRDVRIYSTMGPDPFDPSTTLDLVTHTFTYVDHGFVTGDIVTYGKGAGDQIEGLLDGTDYYVIVIDTVSFQLAASYAEATAATPVPIEPTTQGTGTDHTLQHPYYTSDNLTTQDLLDDIDAALTEAGFGSDIEARELAGRIALEAVSGIDKFTIEVNTDDPAYLELGLLTTAASTVFLTGAVVDTSSLPSSASFGIKMNGAFIGYTINVDLTGASNVGDIVDDINAGLAVAVPDVGVGTVDLTGTIIAGRNGNRLVLAAVDSSIDVFKISNKTNTDALGLHSDQLEDEQVGSVFLSQVAGVFVVGENFLDPETHPDAPLGLAFGRLPGSAPADVIDIDITLTGVGGPYSDTISLNPDDTQDFTKLQDLVDYIDGKIVGDLADKIKPFLISSSEIGLRVISGSITSIEITSGSDLLGLPTGLSADGPLLIGGSRDAPAYYGPASDAVFTIDYDVGGFAQAPVVVTVPVAETLTNSFVFDLVADVNQSMNIAFGGSSSNPFRATFDGQRLVILAKDDSNITHFQISSDETSSTVTELKLRDHVADGGGTEIVVADNADLLVFARDGEIHRVSLDSAVDIQDVIDALKAAGSGADLDAGLNDANTGLYVEDLTDPGDVVPGNLFRIESVNASRAVYELGIQASDISNMLAFSSIALDVDSVIEDGRIDGDEIGTFDLEDRLFIEQIDEDTPILQASVFVFMNLNTAGDPPTSEAQGRYGFVGIELTSKETQWSGRVGIDLNLNDDSERKFTLAELLDAISIDVNQDKVVDIFDLHEVLEFPEFDAESILTYNNYLDFYLTLLDGLAPGTITLGTPPLPSPPTEIRMTFTDIGDPFNMVPGTAAFDASDTNIIDATGDFITLTGHGFTDGDKVTYRAGAGGTVINGLEDNTVYYVNVLNGNEFQLSLSRSGALNNTSYIEIDVGVGTEHRFLRFDPIEPVIDVTGTHLGELANFANIDFEHILAAFEQLSEFLNEFAAQSFLNDPLPVIGLSFNDLLDIATGFAAAVTDLTNNPAATIQSLTQKLRESFGLPPDADIIKLELVDDGDVEGTADESDMLKVSLMIFQQYTESLMVDLDLSDQLNIGTFGGISLLGRAGLGAQLTLDAIFSVGIDLDDDGGGDTFGEVFLFTHEDDTSIFFTVDATSTDITFNASLGPLGVAIIGGDGRIDLQVGFSDEDASAGDIVALSDPLAAFGGFEPSLGSVGGQAFIINLPIYFPTPSTYVGDILFEADIDLDNGVHDVNVVIPTDLLDPDFYTNFGIMSSLPLAVDALDLLLETLQDIMSGQIFGLELPLIGDNLADGVQFIEDLRFEVIAPFQNLIENTPKTEEDLALLVQGFLFGILSEGKGANLLDRFPELDTLLPTNGLGILVDPQTGNPLSDADLPAPGVDFETFKSIIEGFIDIIIDLGNSEVVWDFEIGDTYSPDANFNFDLGFPGLGFGIDGGVGLEVTWNLGLGFGISTEEGPFINIDRRDGSNNPIPELSISVDAGFAPGSSLGGQLGFLQFSATADGDDLTNAQGLSIPNGIDDTNHIFANFTLDLTNGSNPTDTRLSFFELGDLKPVIGMATGASLRLDLELAFNKEILPDVISAILPALVAEFEFDWGISSSNVFDSFEADGETGLSFEDAFVKGLTNVRFLNVGLDLGSFLGDFLGPIVAQIQEVTGPLQPIIDVLTAPIPVISDLAGKPISLIDIASTFGEFDPGLIYALADLITFVNSIPANPGSIILPIEDEFILVGSGLFGDTYKNLLADDTFNFASALDPDSSNFIGGLESAFNSLTSDLDGIFNEAGEFVSSVFEGAFGGDEDAKNSPEADSVGSLFGGDFNSEERGGFAFPFLEDPVSILGALLGRPIVLVTYDLPPLVVEFSWEQSFMIYGPLWGNVGAGLGVKIDLAFGYDTYGVQKFVEGGFENPLDLLAGLFISDTDNPDGSGTDVPELILKGEISVGAELNAGVASAGIQAAIALTFNFDLNDPDSDGRVRIGELLGNFLYEFREGSPLLAPLAIFDIYGDISFQLRAYLEILTVKFTFEITPPIVLIEFSIEFDRQPILATERGDGTLLLNIGPNSESRLHGDTRDIDESINVEQNGNEFKVWSDQFGVPYSAAQTYSGDNILAYGGEFGDTIVIDVSVDVYVEGNSGDDVITLSGSGPAEIYGADGDDIITGGSGKDVIYGGEGNDTIDGGADDDIIFGDEGRISDRMISVLIREKDGEDTISGGEGNDLIFGAGGIDTIGGDNFVNPADPDDGLSDGNDIIIGDGGRVIYQRDIDGDGELDVLSEPEYRSTNSTGGRADVIHGHGGVDLIYAGKGDDEVDGGAGNDEIYGEGGFDYIAGAGDDDLIYGGTENDVIYGYRESFDANDPGFNTGSGADDGPDTIYGETGNDFIRGNNGNDTLLGGRGTDIIFGDFDDDKTFGGADNDYLFGGAGNDESIQGGGANDILFGDDGVVVFIDFGSLPFASTFDNRLGNEIVSNDRLIGDGDWDPNDPYTDTNNASHHDEDPRTLDVIMTEVNGTTDGNDYVVGGEGDDIALGGAKNDSIYGDFDPTDPPDGPIPADVDILIGDGGRIEFNGRERDNIRSLIGADASEVGVDDIHGNGGTDTIFGSGDDDFLYGRMDSIYNSNPALQEDDTVRDDDIILGDDGEIDYEAGTGIIQTIETYFGADALAVGGSDEAYGNKHDDIIFGGIDSDLLKGDDGTDGDDVMLGDNGLIVYQLDDDGERTMIATIETTDTSEATGGPDTIEGQDDNDVIIGGVNNGGPDLLYGDMATPTTESIALDGQDIILGDNGELIFNADGDLDTLDFIRSELLGLGGADELSGNAGNDVLIGSTGGDTMYGDDASASAAASDGEDIMLGDNGDIEFIGTVGRLLVQVIGRDVPSAVDLITTTDVSDAFGGADTMSGNAVADIMLGGVNDGGVDTMYGDQAPPTDVSKLNDGDDIMLGDNGLLDFTHLTDLDRNTLDLIQTFEDTYGGTDIISGNRGLDVGIGGTGDDTIYGDDDPYSAGDLDLNDILIGDNADIFLVAVGGASGADLKVVLDAAVKTIVTTDTIDPTNTGGVDTISGNAGGDVILGGVYGDMLYGDREVPTPESTAIDGDDMILGDNGSFEWLSTGRLSEVTGIDIAANNADLYNWFNGGAGDPADTNLGTLDLITTEQPNSGGRDIIFGDEGNDLVFGGTDLDVIHGDDGDYVGSTDNNDVLFGDHGRIYPQFARFQVPNSTALVPADIPARNFFAIDTGDTDGGAGDIMFGEEGDDLMVGQQGDDRMWGGSQDDDMIGGHNVDTGYDELGSPVVDTLLNPPDDLAMNDIMDGGSGDDAMAGDNAIVWRRGDVFSPRFRELTEDTIYTTGPDQVDTITTNFDVLHQQDPENAVGRDVQLLDHTDAIELNPLGRFGADVMAGGADNDVLYGQLGDDLMQGDGLIESDPAVNPWVSHELDVSDTGVAAPDDTSETLYFNIPENVTDGNDYMEGNGGNDLMYGGLGQDDMIGGSSELFGLDDTNAALLDLTGQELRPDGSDILFGGSGVNIGRNHLGHATIPDPATNAIITDPTGHARDADYIMGDNANLYRLVEVNADASAPDVFLEYEYDQTGEFENRGDERIIVRAMEQLDYTLGGSDYAGGSYTSDGVAVVGGIEDNGRPDLIHGEAGDDHIFGMTGSDVIYGEGQDDDIVGGYGNDWISGGTGQDGILGDDGLVLTSRNSTLGEPLYGIAGLLSKDASTRYSNADALDELIYTPGSIQIALINPEGALKKTIDLVPFSYDPLWRGMDDEFPENGDATPFADDFIFGGLGSDFLHGGSGDDGILGAEALSEAYIPMFDIDGNAVGIINLGYNAFDITNPINPGDVATLTGNPGDALAYNPVDEDGQHQNNRYRAGEFFLYDEYDPRRKILLTATGELWKPGDGDAYEFILNFDETEGVIRPAGEVPKATGQQTEFYPQVNDDGKDALFGDLGNDWLVGGTGRDNLYGGWGNDLLNADDLHDINDDSTKQNTVSDTHPTYEDRAYGGAGRDILIGNTGGDRLIDWVGEYNSYLVPYAPFGQASVSRTLQPFLPEFLYALSAGDGADPTRYVDALGANVPEPTRNNPIPSRFGEPHGELGLVLQKDFAWQQQTGAPADPQAGNIPGGHRDVLRSAGFNDGTSSGFFADSGVWQVDKGSYIVSPVFKGGDALSVFHVDEYVPSYFEMLATLNPLKPTGGYKSNAYIIFDYQSDVDFKFAGINVSTNKLEIGHVTEAGWIVDVQGVSTKSLKSGTNYFAFLALNGNTVTLILDNRTSLSHTFAPRIDDYGIAHGLSEGMVGLGANNAQASIDNVIVQRLAPEMTYAHSDEFDPSVGELFQIPEDGYWFVDNGHYIGSSIGERVAVNLMSPLVAPAAIIQLQAQYSVSGETGYVFDYYNDKEYKFVTVSSSTGEVVIGHHTEKGRFVDASYVLKSAKGTDTHSLDVTLKGSTISVRVDDQIVTGHTFNAIVTDGQFGLLARNGAATFDSVTFLTDDPSFSESDPLANLPTEPLPVAVIDQHHEAGGSTAIVTDDSTETVDDSNLQSGSIEDSSETYRRHSLTQFRGWDEDWLENLFAK